MVSQLASSQEKCTRYTMLLVKYDQILIYKVRSSFLAKLQLMNEFEQEALMRNVEEMILTVNCEHLKAIRVSESLGWVKNIKFREWKGRMKKAIVRAIIVLDENAG